jgi:hypothetical protein
MFELFYASFHLEIRQFAPLHRLHNRPRDALLSALQELLGTFGKNFDNHCLHHIMCVTCRDPLRSEVLSKLDQFAPGDDVELLEELVEGILRFRFHVFALCDRRSLKSQVSSTVRQGQPSQEGPVLGRFKNKTSSKPD